MTKEQFIEILNGTKRAGMENVISKLEETGFFDAPASTKFHLFPAKAGSSSIRSMYTGPH